MAKRKLSVKAAGLAALGGLALASLPGSALAASPDHHIYRTGGDGVVIHEAAGLHTRAIGVLSDGTTFVPDCWTAADFVEGDPIWLHGAASSTAGWVTDYYVDTHWTTTADLVAEGIPRCGDNTRTAPAQPAAAPAVNSATHIVLRSNAGRREHNLQALAPSLDQAASRAGIDGQTLARVIDHEGGNYLDSALRRSTWQQVELAYPGDPSVGIGQIKASTARDVDEQVYHEDNAGLTDFDIRSRLIYDQSYAIRIAAGYLRIMQDEGLGAGWPQFMAYSLSPQLALTWKHAGHPMDGGYLASHGFAVEKFQARQQLYNDAVAAVG